MLPSGTLSVEPFKKKVKKSLTFILLTKLDITRLHSNSEQTAACTSFYLFSSLGINR